MSVRKRIWVDAKGQEHTAWVVDYKDLGGKRRLKTFKLKKEADAFALAAGVEVRDGTHVPDRETATLKEACKTWLKSGTHSGLEQSTLDQYRQHVTLHIQPFLGDVKLSKVTVPLIRQFQDDLRDNGRSAAMVKRVTSSLGSVMAHALERGLAARNPIAELGKRNRSQENREKARLKVGVDIPTVEEVKAMLAHAKGRFRPFLITAVFTGMRASEMRGLPWSAVNFEDATIEVFQRADRYNQIGSPKSKAGRRVIPVPPIVIAALSQWKLECPEGELGLVFPNGNGNIESLGNLVNRGLHPTLVAAGVTEEGKPDRAKYTGLHTLRHWFASWCINRKADGGLELSAKQIQERLGHGSIQMTFDRYGHLFPAPDQTKELEEAAQRLFSVE